MPSIFITSNLEFKKDAAILDSFDLETLTPRLSKETKSENLIFDVRKLNPGKFSFPYHFHHNAEELMMIISGSIAMEKLTICIKTIQSQ